MTSRRPGVAALAVLLFHLGVAHASAFPEIPAGEDQDLSYFEAGGGRLQGPAALVRMAHDADLVLWCAGNQFLAIDDVVAAFRKIRPGARIGVVTLPPELELRAIQMGGWRYQDTDYPGRPDVYGTVAVADLRAAGGIDVYVPYAHNALALLVQEGNPKGVRGLEDLVRPEVRVVLPNPIDEGIMKVYAKPILLNMGIWPQLSEGVDCRNCLKAGHVYFASVHHRESPLRVATDRSDVALVWRTEVEEARRDHPTLEGVALSPAQNAQQAATYFAGVFKAAPHATLAHRFLRFLVAPEGQAAYVSHGFVALGRADQPLLRITPPPAVR